MAECSVSLPICNVPSLMNDWILKLPTSARNKVYAKRTIQSSFFVFSCRAHSDQSSSHPSWISLPRLGPFTSTMVLSRGRVRLYGTLVLITLMPPATQYSETAGAGFDVRSAICCPPNWHDGMMASLLSPGVSNRWHDGRLTWLAVPQIGMTA